MKFNVDIKIFLVLIIFFFTNQINIYTIVMLSTLLHEIGHLIVGITLKMKPKSISLIPLGLAISFGVNIKDFNNKIKKGNLFELKKIFVAAAGPMINILIIIITNSLKIRNDIAVLIMYSNILLIIFNLLPIYPLDGARIVRGILHIFLGKRKSINIIRNISIFTLIFFTAISSICILYFKNIVYILMPLILWIMFSQEEKVFKAKEKIYITLDRIKKENENNKKK